MNYADTKRFAERFARELSNAASPTICPICFFVFSVTLSDDPGTQAHLPRLRAECHALFDACARTLLLPRTSDDYEKLRTLMTTNRLRCRGPASNHNLPTVSPDYLHAVLDGLSQMIHAGLHQGERSAVGRASMPRKAFGDKLGRWPSHTGQLFPYGEKEAVDALLDLCDLQVSGGPLGILNELLCISRAIVFPVLLSERNRMRVVRLIARQTDPAQLRETSRSAPWLVEGDNALLTAAIGFLQILHFGPNALPGDAQELYKGSERILLSALCACLEEAPFDGRTMCVIGPIAIDVFVRAGYPSGVNIPMRVVNLMRSKAEQMTPSFARTLSMLVSQTVKRRRCAAPGCGVAELEASGKPFSTCSRCRVPRYCTKECQARDWKGAAGLPHKKVCPVLCKLDAQSCVDLEYAQFEAKYNTASRALTREDNLVLNEFAITLGRQYGYIFNEAELRAFPGANAV